MQSARPKTHARHEGLPWLETLQDLGAHLAARPSAKSGATVWLVPWRAMKSSQRVGLAMKCSGDMSTSG